MVPSASHVQVGTKKNFNYTRVSPKTAESMVEVPDHYEIEYNLPTNVPDMPDGQDLDVFVSSGNEVVCKEENLTDQRPRNKSNIFDIFWLINPKLVSGETTDPTEAQLVVLSFNADFGNLRIVFNEIGNSAIVDNIIFNKSLKQTIVGTMYPYSCIQTVRGPNDKFSCMEQLINNTGESWLKNRPISVITKTDDCIKLEIYDMQHEKIFFYNFIDWQKEAFIKALEYTYNEGLNVRGQKLISSHIFGGK